MSGVRPLSETLDRVAEEVADLVRLGDQIQGVISRLAVGPPDAATLADAQGADLLSQRLEGLAGFVRALAQAAPGDATHDIEAAIGDLTLTDQARRLSGAPYVAPETDGELFSLWD